MKKILGLGFVALLAASCTNNEPGTITVEADGIESFTLFEINTSSLDTLEVLKQQDGKFKTKVDVDTANFYVLRSEGNFAIPLLLEKGDAPVIKVEGTDDSNRNYTVTGSAGSEQIKKITDITRDAMEELNELDSLSRVYMADSTIDMTAKKAELDSSFMNIIDKANNDMKAIVDENPGNLANLFVFSQAVGRTPVLNAEEDFAYFEKIDDALYEAYPEHPHVTSFHEKMVMARQQNEQNKQAAAKREQLSTGSVMPEIELPNPEGDIIKLSSLRGKVVLVDFWAKWCRPCRAENPNLVRIYNQYKDQGFTVYSISLDGLPQQPTPKEDWTSAIQQDGLSWDNHVSDLQGWNSPVAQNFGITSIPFTILIDRDGTIIDTDLRGPELEAKLVEVL